LNQCGEGFVEQDAVDTCVVRVVIRYVDGREGVTGAEGPVADGCDAGGDGDGGDGGGVKA
jgi:hypothetical protein